MSGTTRQTNLQVWDIFWCGNLQQVATACVKSLTENSIIHLIISRCIKAAEMGTTMTKLHLEEKHRMLSSSISLKRHNRRQPLMTSVAPACWDDTSEAMHNVSVQRELSHRKFCYCHTVASGSFLFWIKSKCCFLSLSLSGVVPHIASVGTYASPLGWTTLPCEATHTHTHKHTCTHKHTTHLGRENEKAVINQLRECMWPRVTSWMLRVRGPQNCSEGSRQSDRQPGESTGWWTDWHTGPREVPRGDGDWKPFFIRSRVQIHSVL